MGDAGLSIRGYAAHRRRLQLPGGSPSAVKKAVDSGRIRTSHDGMIDPSQADLDWARNTSPAKQRADGGGPVAAMAPAPADGPGEADGARQKGGNGYANARTVREVYQAKLARLEYEEKAGNLVARDQVRAQGFKTGRAVRDAMLGIIPRLKAQLAVTDDPEEVEQLLLAEIRLAIKDLAGG